MNIIKTMTIIALVVISLGSKAQGYDDLNLSKIFYQSNNGEDITFRTRHISVFASIKPYYENHQATVELKQANGQRISGDIWIDGIKCFDRKEYYRVNRITTTTYYLTDTESDKLLGNKISHSFSISLTIGGEFYHTRANTDNYYKKEYWNAVNGN